MDTFVKDHVKDIFMNIAKIINKLLKSSNPEKLLNLCVKIVKIIKDSALVVI